MYAFRLRAAALTLAAGIGLSACTTPYGYNGVSVGIGTGYNDPYYGGYGYPGHGYAGYGYGAGYPGYGYGYGFDPFWGWNDDFYYPGTGYYVYDRYRRPFRWTDAQRRYWELRRQRALSTSTTSNPVVIRDNWGDFDRKGNDFGRVVRKVDRQERIERQQQVERNTEQPARVERRVDRPERVQRRIDRSERIERSQQRAERRQQQAERSTARAERSSTRVERKSETRSERTGRSNGQNRGNEREE